MKIESIRIVRTSTGFALRASLPPMSRARTTGDAILDLSERTDLGGGETTFGQFSTREQAERALARLKSKA